MTWVCCKKDRQNIRYSYGIFYYIKDNLPSPNVLLLLRS